MNANRMLAAALAVAGACAAPPDPTPQAHELAIPSSIVHEHEHLHADLVELTGAEGAVGATARDVAEKLHAHFVAEEDFALPPLALLEPLSRGESAPSASAAIEMTRRLRAELPRMLAEHREIAAALRELESAARAHGHAQAARFAQALMVHARNEEEILYPAALLVGETLEGRPKPVR